MYIIVFNISKIDMTTFTVNEEASYVLFLQPSSCGMDWQLLDFEEYFFLFSHKKKEKKI